MVCQWHSFLVACVAVSIVLSGCGHVYDCDGKDKAAQNYTGQWINVASSSGQQTYNLKEGWTVEGGRPQSGWWSAAEAAIKLGFDAVGAEAGIPVTGDVAASFVQHIADYFDPKIDGVEGQKSYSVKFTQAGTVWQWQIQNGQDCKGTKLTTKDTMLTSLKDSSYPPCCLPTMFADENPHGLCTNGSPNLCATITTPHPRTGTCLKKSPDNACGECQTESDCGSEGASCAGSACCQAAADKSCNSTTTTTTSATTSSAPNATSWCNKLSPSNACNPCKHEGDCGNTADGQFFCWAAKDARCDPVSLTGWCKHDSPARACQTCTVEADCGNTEVGAVYCWADKDPSCSSLPSMLAIASGNNGWCKHDSPSNACKACSVEADCGNTAGGAAYCWADKDPACSSVSPVLAVASGGSGWCKHDSPSNACKACKVEADCGNTATGTYYCWADKDPACSSMSPVLSISSGNGWCKHDSPSNACKACSVEADCGNTAAVGVYCWADKDPACSSVTSVIAGGSGWCKHDSPSNACKACSVEADCGNIAGGAAYCWADKDPACTSASLAFVTGGSGVCKHDSPSNACQPCSVEAECGNTNPSKVYCWAQKDALCPFTLSV